MVMEMEVTDSTKTSLKRTPSQKRSKNSDEAKDKNTNEKPEIKSAEKTHPLTLENVILHTMITGGQADPLFPNNPDSNVPSMFNPKKRGRTRRRGSKATLQSYASYKIHDDAANGVVASDANGSDANADKDTLVSQINGIDNHGPKKNTSKAKATSTPAKTPNAKDMKPNNDGKKSNFFGRNGLFRRSKSVDNKKIVREMHKLKRQQMEEEAIVKPMPLSRRGSMGIIQSPPIKSSISSGLDMLCHSTPNVAGEQPYSPSSSKSKSKPHISRNLFGKDIFKRSKSNDQFLKSESAQNTSNMKYNKNENKSNDSKDVVEGTKSNNLTKDENSPAIQRPKLQRSASAISPKTRMQKSATDPDFLRKSMKHARTVEQNIFAQNQMEDNSEIKYIDSQNSTLTSSKEGTPENEDEPTENENAENSTIPEQSSNIIKPEVVEKVPNLPEPSIERSTRRTRKRDRGSQQQRSFRSKKSDPRRKSADFGSFVQQRQMIDKAPEPGYMYPDNPDGKMLSKATRVLQDVSDRNKTNLSCIPSSKSSNLYKENSVIPNYNGNEQYIVDKNNKITYVRGRLLGKGGFAKCYEMIDTKTNKTYAGKIISKSRLTKPHQRDKIAREIELHKPLRHKNVVGFHSYFEDEHNVYIILELCSRKSLVHVLKQRKTLTEPEVRHYLAHLVAGTRYIHKENIIHRDLKLGNMLLNEAMQVKIADFGLATRVEYDGEKKMTVCGTPNYIAPEVLQKKGHSYEADIWAMGCVMYAMLVGRPPFETSTLKETYMRITSNKYFVPPHVSKSAKHLIQKLLHPDPLQRPTLETILRDEFFTAGYNPKNLSTACCEVAPKWPSSSHGPQRPKSYAAPVSPSEAMHKITSSLANWKGSKKSASQIITRPHAKDDMHVNNHHHGNKHQNDRHQETPRNSGGGGGGGGGGEDQSRSQHSLVSSDSRKSSRDRSPHPAVSHSRSRSAGGESSRRTHAHHHQAQQQQVRAKHNSGERASSRNGGGDERSRSPPKSPRQVVIETKPSHHQHTPKSGHSGGVGISNAKSATSVISNGTITGANGANTAATEANNNNTVIANQHVVTNGYHPAMVLCSPAPAHHGSQRSGFTVGSGGNATTNPLSLSSAPTPQPAPGSASSTHASNPQLAKSTSHNSVQQASQPYGVQDVKTLPVGSAIRLYQMLATCLDQMPQDSKPTPVQNAKPLWVTKWVDYSNKYGFGFQLSDKGVGVLFNDTTRMLLAPDGKTVQYNDLSNRVYTFTTDTCPSEHSKKSTLLLYFAQYMGEHLIHGGDLLAHHKAAAPVATSSSSAMFMKKWFRTSRAIIMYLNNGTLQVNFFDDHTKVILSPEGQDYMVTYINSSRQSISYRLLQFRHFGCSSDIAERLSYARKMLESIINIEGETV